jgi:O-antigen/teichoic acid export membrane protein
LALLARVVTFLCGSLVGPGGILEPRSSILGRAGPLIAARLAAAVLSLSIPLVLARVMAFTEYGTYKQLFLVSTTAAAILPLGMAQSLYFFVPRAPSARPVLGQTLAFVLVTGALGAAVLWAAGPWIARALSNPGLLEHRQELALFTGLVVAASPLEVSMTAQGRTRRSATVYLASDALKALAIVLPTLAGLGLHAVMRGMVAWAALRLAAAWTVALRPARGPLWDRRLLRRQLTYALPFGLAIAIAIPQQYAHQFVVAHSVGPALFAIYAVGVFELPFVDLFYTPTGEVLMVHLGELDSAGRREEGAAAFREAVEKLSIVLLPPIAFIWAVAPAFITTLFGARFAGAAPVFRIALLVMPLAIFPLDATLRARGETRHILRSYLLKATVAIPLAWIGVQRLGLIGAAGSYVTAECMGRAFLAWRVPRSLSSPAQRIRAWDLVPWRQLSRTAAMSLALALAGAGTLHQAAGAGLGGAPGVVQRSFPFAVACALFTVGYLGALVASGAALPGAPGAILARAAARLRPAPLDPIPPEGGRSGRGAGGRRAPAGGRAGRGPPPCDPA